MTTTSDTFDRSCSHWSEEGRAEMEQFYRIASVDYRHLAEARDWNAWLTEKQKGLDGRRLRLLDVACGSGKFPVALGQYADIGNGSVAELDYALLDPSSFSIAEAKAALEPPFLPSTEYHCTLQDLDAPTGHYDAMWATHALYAVPPAELGDALTQMIRALHGEAFIAHAFADSHYLRFQAAFLKAFNRTGETRYAAAEDLVAALKDIGATYKVDEITYENGAPLEDRAAVEGYLQRCVFDDSVTLEQMESAPALSPYLDSCRETGAWRFRQRVALISIFN